VVADLARRDLGLAQRILPRGLIEMAPADAHGDAPVIGPSSRMPGENLMLGPVRVLGWHKQANSGDYLPILHTKLLLLGYSELLEGLGEFGEDIERLVPVETWLGSANWTRSSRSSLELGLWSSDLGLGKAVLEYLIALIKFSEPHDSPKTFPEPELIAAVWDDAAFAEYMDEYGWRYGDPDEEG
jgi:hypothetical protein